MQKSVGWKNQKARERIESAGSGTRPLKILDVLVSLLYRSHPSAPVGPGDTSSQQLTLCPRDASSTSSVT